MEVFKIIYDIVNKALTIASYMFIIRTKNLWDLMYFEKISEIYNLEFIFGDNQKSCLRKEFESSRKQLNINKRAIKWFILCIIIAEVFTIM